MLRAKIKKVLFTCCNHAFRLKTETFRTVTSMYYVKELVTIGTSILHVLKEFSMKIKLGIAKAHNYAI